MNDLEAKQNLEYVKSKGLPARALQSMLPNVMHATTERFKEHSIESAASEAEQILSHVLHEPRHQLHLNSRRSLTQNQLTAVEKIIERRCRREPLQYILGTTEFFGLEIECTPAALIPRPETELLVEAVIKLAKNFSRTRILDLGTGTGCIALALAAHLPDARIVATDISEEALILARRNAQRLGLLPRVRFAKVDMLAADAFAGVEPQHIIISNPPYVLQAERAELQPEIRDWEPEAALYVEDDGLKYYRAIAGLAGRHLIPGGYVAVEMASQRAKQIAEVLVAEGFAAQEIVNDYNGHERHLIAMKMSAFDAHS